jgi:deoxyribonuclease V
MKPFHNWKLTPEEAIQAQRELRGHIELSWDEKRTVNTVGGVDMGITGELARCAIVVLRFPELTPIEGVTATVPLIFPYIPGLLAFREGPAVIAAWDKLTTKPGLMMFDGQGIAHPRGIGIASHIGILLEKPSIGVAKSRLYGRHEPVGPQRGDRAVLHDNRGNVLGSVLRTKERTNPLYISPGHLIDVEHAVEFVMECCTSYRLPEPTRWAHKVAGGEKLPVEDGNQPRLF